MRKVIFLMGLMLVFSAISVYGQENTEMQNANGQSQESKTFNEPLEKRVEKAVSGMEKYGEEIQKEIEPIKGKEEKYKTFFSRLHNYVSHYIRDNSIKELLALEAQILKKGEGPESIYGWFYVGVHNTVLKLAGYSPISDVPITDKILEIIQDKTVDDYVRSKYVIDVGLKITDLHNKRRDVSEAIKEKISPILIKIIDDTTNSSVLRAETAATLVSIGRNNNEITKYIVRLFDDKDDLVKERTMWHCDLANDELRNRIIAILKNKDKYSKKIIEEAMIVVAKYPEKTSEAIPYLLEMIKDVKSSEEFKKISSDLKEYNDPSVMGPILQKFKEFGLEGDSTIYYLKNSILLDYLPMAKAEDKLLVLKLINETSYEMIGNVYTPPHFDKAVTALKDYLSSSDTAIQKETMEIYGEIIEMANSVASNSTRKEATSQLGKIKEIIIDCKNKIKDPLVITELSKLMKKIEKTENQSKEP